jgi:hypothetical protein
MPDHDRDVDPEGAGTPRGGTAPTSPRVGRPGPAGSADGATGDVPATTVATVDRSSTDAGVDGGRRPRRRLDRGLLLASLVIAGGLVLIAWGLLGSVTGDEGIDRPDAIETLSPVENAVQALQQERIVVDLDFGYEAELEIDGQRLPVTRLGELELEPGEQADLPPTAVFDPGNSVISFQPTEGAPIESFAEGRHEVRVIFWRAAEGPDSARSYTWSFDVI